MNPTTRHRLRSPSLLLALLLAASMTTACGADDEPGGDALVETDTSDTALQPDADAPDSSAPETSDADGDGYALSNIGCDAATTVFCCGEGEEIVAVDCIDGYRACPTGTTVAPNEGCGPAPGAMCDAEVDCNRLGWCDFPANGCGAAGVEAVCVERPTACDEVLDPVCGCDGQVYDNACEAEAAGVDVDVDNACAPPQDTFACGEGFCAVGQQYCQRTTSDVGGVADTFGCMPLPVACADAPDCTCLAGEPCAPLCEVDAGGNLILTCPGG